MSPWTVKLWRLAWARTTYLAIGGWCRLFGRLWWREAQAPKRERLKAPAVMFPPVAIKRELLPDTHLGKRLVHWAPHLDGIPFCGDPDGRDLWTGSIESATCPGCLNLGEPVALQYWTGTR